MPDNETDNPEGYCRRLTQNMLTLAQLGYFDLPVDMLFAHDAVMSGNEPNTDLPVPNQITGYDKDLDRDHWWNELAIDEKILGARTPQERVDRYLRESEKG